MKYYSNILLLILSVVVSVSCSSDKHFKDEYAVDGFINGIKEGKAVLAKLDLVSNERVDLDSAEIQDGRFHFRGRVQHPYLHAIYFDGREKPIHFFLENSKITIHADILDPDRAKIVGSREDSLFRTYATDDIFDRKKGMRIMLDHPDYVFSAFTAYYQFQLFAIEADTMAMILDRFDVDVKKSEYYRHLESLYQTLGRVAVSRPAPQFSIPDTNGLLVPLADLKGKYVLLDFWASWCAPCRAANPKLVEIYNEFRRRNFTILGISVDKDRDRWLRAIESDRLPWTNLSNLTGWDAVTDAYAVKAVPQNFLLDPEGIIIAKNIEPELLKEKLEAILPPEQPAKN